MKPHVPLEVMYARQGFPMQELNDSIQHLQDEHTLLQQQLLELYGMAEAIGWDEDVINWIGSLKDLKLKVTHFMETLHQHSVWEENTLFPMVAWYFGETMDEFTQMEQEHEIAEQYIAAFLDAAERMFQIVPRSEARLMASYLLQAYDVLYQHFYKEEELLAALANRSNAIGF
ncbi:hemerythrin domain-containing protein [Paenibacillus silviterrae]|uniref:hemerythrin domain-containing protein n=1 Tax=Paenibacillus silviterrae TaxID=3242194 RepID=UPI002542EED8|nr:hemerythrin domain-containing protein [Paenibacillus chinjuensis]